MLKDVTTPGAKRMIIRKIIIYAIAFFVLGILQCAFFARLRPFGATPDVILGGICAVMLMDNRRSAAVVSLASGYFIDAIGAHTPSFSPVFYLLCVLLVGAIADKMMPSFWSFGACVGVGAGLEILRTFVSAWIYYGVLPSVSFLWHTLLPEAISTFIISLPVYFVIKLCMLPIGARGRFSL